MFHIKERPTKQKKTPKKNHSDSTKKFSETDIIINTTGADSRAGPAYPSDAHEFAANFLWVRVTRSLVLCECVVDCCLSVCPFSIGYCVVCPSIYGF